jgi:hypothetical protein
MRIIARNLYSESSSSGWFLLPSTTELADDVRDGTAEAPMPVPGSLFALSSSEGAAAGPDAVLDSARLRGCEPDSCGRAWPDCCGDVEKESAASDGMVEEPTTPGRFRLGPTS